MYILRMCLKDFERIREEEAMTGSKADYPAATNRLLNGVHTTASSSCVVPASSRVIFTRKKTDL